MLVFMLHSVLPASLQLLMAYSGHSLRIKTTGPPGNSSHTGGGGLNSQNLCKLTKCFFACQFLFFVHFGGRKRELIWEVWGGHLFSNDATEMAKL